MRKVKPARKATERLDIRLPPDLLDQAEQFAFLGKESLSNLVRRAVAKEIGLPELAESLPRGRPKSA